MITRGSKYFYGAALVGYLAALVYGFVTEAASQGGIAALFTDGGIVNAVVGPISFGWRGGVGDQIGYSILMGFAGIMAVLGGMSSAFRDGSPEALAEVQGARIEDGTLVVGAADLRIATPVGLSYWPAIGALSLGAVIVGLATSPGLFLIGLAGVVVVTVEWTVRAWSERATGDPALNRQIRNRFMYPIEIPVGATLVIGVVVLAMSRILLAVPQTAAVFFIILLASAVFAVAILLANRPELKRSVLVGVLFFGVVALVAGGIAAAIVGPREEGQGAAHTTSIESGVTLSVTTGE
jgi:hypothetical protein